MNYKLITGLLILVLLAIPVALAVPYEPGEYIVLRARLHSEEEAVDGLANISIWYPNSTIDITNATMTDGDALGDFIYPYTFDANTVGDYLVRVDFYNITDNTYYGSSEAIYQVRTNIDTQILDELSGNLPVPLPTETQERHYCPHFRQLDEEWLVWLDYEYAINASDVNGTVELFDGLTTYNLTYNPTYSRYQNTFTSAIPIFWNYTISATATGLDSQSVSCYTHVTTSLGLSIRLWEEVPTEAYDYNGNYIVTQKNYDKEFDDTYINDFAYILARNNDLNATGEYEYCQLPIGSASSLVNTINIGGWLNGNNLTKTVIDLLSADDYIGCDKYWYTEKYINGEANIAVPQSGNYSLYLLDGILEFENSVSPPKVVKSNLFLPLGNIKLPTNESYEADFYITHAELDSWGAMTDSFFVILILLVPFIMLLLLISTDYVPVNWFISISLGWIILLVIIKML